MAKIERDGMTVSQGHRLAQAFDGDGAFEHLSSACLNPGDSIRFAVRQRGPNSLFMQTTNQWLEARNQ